MFGSRNRSLVTVAAVVEATLAGWVLGQGRLALLVMIIAVTGCDTLWGILRRRAAADLAGLQMAAALALLVAVRADLTLTALVACGCAAWLIRPERRQPLRRMEGARTAR
jgi:hypothetical protein